MYFCVSITNLNLFLGGGTGNLILSYEDNTIRHWVTRGKPDFFFFGGVKKNLVEFMKNKSKNHDLKKKNLIPSAVNRLFNIGITSNSKSRKSSGRKVKNRKYRDHNGPHLPSGHVTKLLTSI